MPSTADNKQETHRKFSDDEYAKLNGYLAAIRNGDDSQANPLMKLAGGRIDDISSYYLKKHDIDEVIDEAARKDLVADAVMDGLRLIKEKKDNPETALWSAFSQRVASFLETRIKTLSNAKAETDFLVPLNLETTPDASAAGKTEARLNAVKKAIHALPEDRQFAYITETMGSAKLTDRKLSAQENIELARSLAVIPEDTVVTSTDAQVSFDGKTVNKRNPSYLNREADALSVKAATASWADKFDSPLVPAVERARGKIRSLFKHENGQDFDSMQLFMKLELTPEQFHAVMDAKLPEDTRARNTLIDEKNEIAFKMMTSIQLEGEIDSVQNIQNYRRRRDTMKASLEDIFLQAKPDIVLPEILAKNKGRG